MRLSNEGSAAYKQHQRDAPALFPDPERLKVSPDGLVRSTFAGPQGRQLLEARGLLHLWADFGPDPSQPGALEALHAAALEVEIERSGDAQEVPEERRSEEIGLVLIAQWREGAGPVSPFARMAVTLVDVALEFVAANPSLVGAGGNGEKFVGALAANLAAMIPDDPEEWGPRRRFAERLLAGFLRAGLRTLAESPELVVEEEHLQKLVGSSLPPVFNALPQDLTKQPQWRDTLEALIGPAASAAMRTVADHPAAFLGRRFDADEAAGAVTQAVLRQAAEGGLAQSVSRAGWVAILQAALGVAAERPELFVRGDAPRDVVARDLVGGIADVLARADPRFRDGLGVELASAVLEVAGTHASAFLDPEDPWESVAANVLGELIGGLQEGLADPARLTELVSRRQLTDLARIVLEQAARTPQMIAGDGELQRVVAAVAQAMAADEHLLLSEGDWREIARAAALEAASNPGRLFDRVSARSGGLIGTALITSLLRAAAADLAEGGRADGGVLFGETLRQAIVVTLQATSGNVRAAIENEAALEKLVLELSALVRRESDLLGSKEWLRSYRLLLDPVLAGEAPPELTVERVEALLTEGGLA